MAVRRSCNFINQQRVDVPHLRSIESAMRNDFDELLKAFVLGEAKSYVLRGFEISMVGAIGSSANGLQLIVDEGSIFHATSNEAGTFLVVPAGTANETLNSTVNTAVEGSFTSSALNYIGLEFDRSVDDTTTSQIYLWNPTNQNEITKTLPLAETLNYKIIITSSIFASNVLPLAIVETDASNNVLNVTDRRPLLFRLGTAGSSTPDPFYVYPWTNHSEGRVENFWKSSSSTSPFRGGDKQILTMKEWMDAVMSNLLEIKGTTYWYSFNSGGSIIKARQDLGNTIFTGRGNVSHSSVTPGRINWSENIYLTLISSRLRYKLAKNATSSNLVLADNQVAYINIIRDVDITPNLIFTNASAVVTSVGAVAWTGDVLAGDFIRIASEDYTKYYEILTVDSLSQVTLTEVFAETSTGSSGKQAKYAWGTYQTDPAPSTDRHIYIADRESVPFNEDVYWLFVREDHGSSIPRVYVRFLGTELESGESQEINDNTTLEVIKYTGMSSESDSTPDYTTAVANYEVTRIAAPEGEDVTSGQYFTIYSANDAVGYYVWFNVNGLGGDPTPPLLTAVPVAINSTDSRNTVASAIAVALNALPAFAGSATLNVATITNEVIGPSTNAANVNVGGAITITTITQGISGTLNGQSNYNSNNDENLTVRAAKLTAMMADKAQDKTIKFGADFDSVVNTTNVLLQDITFISTGTNTLNIMLPSSTNNGTVGLGGTLSLAANQAAYFVIDRNAAFSFANLNALTVANISAVPLNENVFIFAYRLASTDVYFWDGLKSSVGSTPSPTFLQKIVQQNNNLKMIEGGTWSWNLGTTTLTWSANAYIQIPGLANNVNRILAGNNNALADGEVLYVEVKRITGASDLTVNRAAIAAVPLTDNTVIIARRLGNDVIVGTGTDRLIDGQSMQLDEAISDQLLSYMGASNEADSSPDYLNAVATAVAQVTSISCVNAAGLTSGQFFKIYSANNETRYYVWFNKDVAGGDPKPLGFTGIEITVTTGDTAAQVTDAVAAALDLLSDFVAPATGTGTILVTNSVVGSCDSAVDVNSSSTIVVSIPGVEEVNHNIVDNDSLTVSVKKIDKEVYDNKKSIDDYFGQLRIRARAVPNTTIDLSGADIVTEDGTKLIQTTSNLLLDFKGANINFATGVILDHAGNPMGINFTPAVIPAGQYHWYSITLLPSATTTDNKISAQILVLAGASSGLTPEAASKAPFSGSGIKIGQVVVQESAGSIANISQSAIHQLGTGGSGGGAGDASADLGRLQDRLNLSLFEYCTANVASQDEDDKLDVSSTATYDIPNQMFKFENAGDRLVSTQNLDSEFLSEGLDVPTVELYTIHDLDSIDTTMVYQVSRNGGNEWQTVTTSRIGNSDVYRGTHTFTDEAAYSFTQTENPAAALTTELNAVNSFSELFVLASATVVQEITARITTVNGTPTGMIFAKIVRDNAGSPSTDPNDIMAECAGLDVSTIVAGLISWNCSVALPAGSYHVVIYSDATYKSIFVTGVTSLVFQTNVAADFTSPYILLEGRVLDLRVRLTSGGAASDNFVRAYGVYYKYMNGVQATNDLNRYIYSFAGAANENEFTITFLPDCKLLMVFALGTGQVFRYGDFTIQGNTVIFPANTFNLPGQTITLEFLQITSILTGISSEGDALLTANHLGSTDATIDRSVAGYGIMLRRPDGTLREVAIDNSDNIVIYSV